jgi:transcriptional regulator with AAA-type ATPase domain
MISPSPTLSIALIGSLDTCRRLEALIHHTGIPAQVFHGRPTEAWSVVLTHRPQLLIIEIGHAYGERQHAAFRRSLAQIRDRFGTELLVAAALFAPEKLRYGGDLLFETGDSLAPSGLLDTFIATPPTGMPTVPDFGAQLANMLQIVTFELARRSEGKRPLPALGISGWVQSMADPTSRDLWCRWLPRYASYTNENPLIIGATGTGKTNLAQALHLFSGRPGQFVSITPRDFSSSELVQAELFGAVAGAYTGAVEKWGLVKRAEKGTLFIDELQSIDKELQGKLITFIENKVYRRVGSADTVEADVRFVFASNRSLYDMMESNILRDDFAYRLERVQLELKPLHERRLDIAAALAFALAKVTRQRPHARSIDGLTSNAYRLLFAQRWPGNLRQLENTVAQLCEVTDINGGSIIDERAVQEVFSSRLLRTMTSGPEILAQAALSVCESAITLNEGRVEAGAHRFIESARQLALEASAGDWERAAELIDDRKDLMRLFLETAPLKRIARGTGAA